MARVEELDLEKHPELNDIVDQIIGERRHLYPNGMVKGNHLHHLYGVLLHRPPVAKGWLTLISSLRQNSKLTAADQELAIVLVAIMNHSKFEFDSHAPKLIKAGATQAQVDALKDWRSSRLFSDRQRRILEYTEVMTRTVLIPDETFKLVREIYNDEQLVEMTCLIAAYNFTTRVTVGLQMGH
jgi:AhpD family alkylhydroperoxidase